MTRKFTRSPELASLEAVANHPAMPDQPKPPSSPLHDLRSSLADRAKGVAAPKPVGDRSEQDRIFDAAAELFLRNGFPRTQLDDVARQSGVGLSAVMKVCFSKEELLYRVLQREVGELVTEAMGPVSEDVPFPELMRIVAERAFGVIESRPLVLRLLLGLWDAEAPAWEERFHELRQRLISVPQEVLRIGVLRGVLRDDLPLELAAALLFEVHVAGYLLHHRPGPDQALRAEQRRALAIDVLFNGMRVRDA